MAQLSLFDSRPPAEPNAPDINFIRKSLNRALRQLREALWMPWDAARTAAWERDFPEMAAQLPEDEAVELTSRFALELERLRGQ